MVEPVSTAAVLGGAGIGALGNLAGSWLSGKSAKKAAKQANALSIWQQLQNQQWQEYMSSTAHQREVQDLKAAGLNPVLSANNGASIGSGGIGNSPQSASIDYTSSAKGATEGFEKALALKSMENQTDVTEADVGLKNATKAETNSKKDLADLEKALLEIQKPKIIATAKAEKAQAELQEELSNIDKEVMKNPIYQAGRKFKTIANEYLGPIGTIFGMATSGAKTAIANKVANNYGRYETLTENYDGNRNPLSFKVHHYNK